MASNRYKVLNPHDLPAGDAILRRGPKAWREGEIFTRPADLPQADVDGLVRQGYLKEVSGGETTRTR